MYETDYTKIGMRIRQIRKAKGWSQDELAKKCGISMSFMGHIERGTRIMSLDTFVNICSALSADADELLWGVAHPSDSSLVDMWEMPDKKQDVETDKQAQDNEVDDNCITKKNHYKNPDSYSMYVKIMKSVAEIMNEA